jgi:hypothetical protein
MRQQEKHRTNINFSDRLAERRPNSPTKTLEIKEKTKPL